MPAKTPLARFIDSFPTQCALADLLQVRPSTVSRWRHGLSHPPQSSVVGLELLAHATGRPSIYPQVRARLLAHGVLQPCKAFNGYPESDWRCTQDAGHPGACRLVPK